MAGTTLGFLKFVLGFDSIQFKKGMTDAERDMVRLQKKVQDIGRKTVDLGAKMSIGITAPFAALVGTGIREAKNMDAAVAQVRAGLASMGPVAGKSLDELTAAADRFEKSSLFGAEEILQDVTANLLTFGNVAGTQFDRAQQAAVDMATKLQIGPKEATIQLGKALNDPIKGITALGRAGIQFSAEQKAMIKSLVETGQTAAAQTLILDELEKQFGGAAQAAQDADPYNALADSWGELSETVARKILPALIPLIDKLGGVLQAFTNLDPGIQTFIIGAAATAAAIGPILVVGGSLIKLLAGIGPAIVAVTKGWAAFKTAMVAARLAAVTTLPALVPLLAPLAAITVAVGAVYLAWKNWDKITAFVKGVYTGVKTWVMDKLGAVFNWLKGKLKAVGDWFFDLYDRVVGHSYVPDMVDEIGDHMRRLEAEMVAPAQGATSAATQAFAEMAGRVKSILDRLYPDQAAANRFAEDLRTLTTEMQKLGFSAEQTSNAVGRLWRERINAEASGALGDGALPSNFGTQSIVGPVNDQALKDIAAGLDVIPVKAKAANEELARMADYALRDIATGLTEIRKLSDVFDVLRDALMDFVQEWLRAQIYKGLTSLAGGLGVPLAGARAKGGPVLSGSSYLVGERGPEIFTPSRSGRIIANDRIAAASGAPMIGNLSVNVPGALSRQQARETGYQVGRGIEQQIRQAQVR